MVGIAVERAEFDPKADMGSGGTLPTFSAEVRVDRILKRTKPADLRAQQPAKFELAINPQQRRALGLSIPLTLRRCRLPAIE